MIPAIAGAQDAMMETVFISKYLLAVLNYSLTRIMGQDEHKRTGDMVCHWSVGNVAATTRSFITQLFSLAFENLKPSRL